MKIPELESKYIIVPIDRIGQIWLHRNSDYDNPIDEFAWSVPVINADNQVNTITHVIDELREFGFLTHKVESVRKWLELERQANGWINRAVDYSLFLVEVTSDSGVESFHQNGLDFELMSLEQTLQIYSDLSLHSVTLSHLAHPSVAAFVNQLCPPKPSKDNGR